MITEEKIYEAICSVQESRDSCNKAMSILSGNRAEIKIEEYFGEDAVLYQAWEVIGLAYSMLSTAQAQLKIELRKKKIKKDSMDGSNA
jgi:hypothetical protein